HDRGIHRPGRADPVLRPHRRQPGVLLRRHLPARLDAADGRAAGRGVPAGRAADPRAGARLRRQPVGDHRVRRRTLLPLPRPQKGGTMITVHGATKRYGSATVLDAVSLELGGEGVTALIGPNGAGKSTLFGLIGRLIAADGGTISVDGADVASAPSAELAKSLAVLRQDNHIAARLTVQDLVEFGRFPHSRGRLTMADREHIDRAIDYLN